MVIGGVAGHEGHYRVLDTVLNAVLLCVALGVTGCNTMLHGVTRWGRSSREDNPVITLSISSLTAAALVGSGCWHR